MASIQGQIDQDRGFIRARGDRLSQDAEDRALQERLLRQNYRRYGDEVYDPLIGGRGGYSPEEREAITREQEMYGLLPGDEGYERNFLSQGEQQSIYGNPWARAAYFDPESMTARSGESAGRQRGAVDEMSRGTYEAIDPGQLGLSDEYTGGVDATLGGTEGRVRGAIDPARLRADQSALDTIRMSPGEKQDIITSAGVSAGQGYRAAIGDMERSGRAAGLDPSGISAQRLRYERAAAGSAGDSETQARVAAGAEEARRAAQAEGIRGAGETAYTDRATESELRLGGQRVGAQERREGLRLGAAQDVSDRKMAAAARTGGARLSAEQELDRQRRRVEEYNTGTGTDIATGIERDEAERNRYIAANRQNTARQNQQQRFNQGMAVSGEASARNLQTAQARREDAREGRGYLREQAGAAQQAEQTDYDRQRGLYGQQGQMQMGTTGQKIEHDRRPRWWEKAIGAGIQGAGLVMSGGASGATKKPGM